MTFENDHTDAEIARREMSYELGEESPEERRWFRWVKDVEVLLGQDLDGDDDIDCFSIDFGYDAFQRGDTPETYAGGVHRRREALAAELRTAGHLNPRYVRNGWHSDDLLGIACPVPPADLTAALVRVSKGAEPCPA